MHTKKKITKNRLNLTTILLGVLSITASFSVGIQTSGNIETIPPSEATDMILTGDIDGNGILNEQDVIALLEITRGYNDPTPAQLRADPNGDGHLTVDDAIRLLHDLSVR